MTSCPVCFEENEEQMVALKHCSHGICRPCLKRWFEVCEQTGQDIPTCPKCRLCVEKDETTDILGHVFTPAGSSGIVQGETDEMDEFTQQLLRETARACGNCGVWIVKEEGCDMMQCVCGYRFCFGCGVAGGRDCGCTPSYHVFYDNVVGQNATRASVHLATAEELEELRLYLERSKVRGLMENILTEFVRFRMRGQCLHCFNQIRPDPAFARGLLSWVSNNCTCDRLTFSDNAAFRGIMDERDHVKLISLTEELQNLRSFLWVLRAKNDLLHRLKVKHKHCGGKGWDLFWQSSSQLQGSGGINQHELKALRQMLQVRNAKEDLRRDIYSKRRRFNPFLRSNPFQVWNVIVSSHISAGVHGAVTSNEEIKFLLSFLQLRKTMAQVRSQIRQRPPVKYVTFRRS